MFTGLIEKIGKVKGLVASSLQIEADNDWLQEIKEGDSVAVNGACLTVTDLSRGSFQADVMPETLRKTNLGSLLPGHRLNLERALRLSDRLGGHLVSGHIDDVIRLISKVREENALVLRFSIKEALAKYIIPKGSVAIDGVSLTVVEVDRAYFTVSLIPLTANQTTLGSREIGYLANLEADLIGKYVERLLGTRKEGLSLGFLAQHGFGG